MMFRKSVIVPQFLWQWLLVLLLVPGVVLLRDPSWEHHSTKCPKLLNFHLETNQLNFGCQTSLGTLTWAESNYTSYSQFELFYIITSDIKRHVCSIELNFSKLDNLTRRYSQWNSTTLCNEFQSRIVNASLNPPESINLVTLKWKNKADCEFACFRNLKSDVYQYCKFILEFYTVVPATQKLDNKWETTQQSSLKGNGNGNSSYEYKKVTEPAKSKNGSHYPMVGSTSKEYDQSSPKTNSERPAGDDNKNQTKLPPLGKNLTHSPANSDEFSNHAAFQQSPVSRTDVEESHFFIYFILVSGICILFYVMMYNKKKILALAIEGRRRKVKRRPNTAAYTKLDCNLEEAMASGPSASTSNTLLY